MARQRIARLGPTAAALALLIGSAAVPAAPAAGRYNGELCVTIGQQPQSCGPVDVQVLSAQRLTARVADIAYRLELRSSQLDVVTMHGLMQIDGFVAPYEWAGTALRFDDLEKRTRYELTLTR